MHRPARALARVLALVLVTLVAGASLVSLGPAATAGRGPSLDKQRQQVVRAVGRVDAAVTRATTARQLRGLDREVQDAVIANADVDHAGLDELVGDAGSAASRADLRTVSTALRGYRPDNYVVVITALRASAHLAGDVADARDELADDPDAQLALDDVELLVDDAVAAALAVTATSDRADRQAVKVALTDARDALEAVTGA